MPTNDNPERNTDAASRQAVPPDHEVVAAVRAGDLAAFSLLWQRHHGAALTAARRTSTSVSAEDVVSEAYVKVLEIVQRGGGPRGAFRPYLYRVIRSIIIDQVGSVEEPSETLDLFPAVHRDAPWEDLAFDKDAVAAAFASLQARWQEALWYSEVEDLPPREIAHLLGISANGVSALLVRARDALRSAWVEAHVQRENAPPECREVLQDLQRFERKKLTAARSRAVAAHLEVCDECRRSRGMLADLNRKLALLLITVLLGGGVPGAATFGAASAAEAQELSNRPTDLRRMRFTSAPTKIVVTSMVALTIASVALAAGFSSFSRTDIPAEWDPEASSAREHDSPGRSDDRDSESGGIEASIEDGSDRSEGDPNDLGRAEGAHAPPPPPGPASPGERTTDHSANGDGTATGEPRGSDSGVEGQWPGETLPDGASSRADASASTGGGSGSSSSGDAAGSDEPAGPGLDMSVGFSCLVHLGDGDFALSGVASTPGVIQARIILEDSSVAVNIFEYSRFIDAHGNVYRDVLTETAPAPDPRWRTPVLTPLSQWQGLEGVDLSYVTIELRLLAPGGRHSPWEAVSLAPPCSLSESLQSPSSGTPQSRSR